MASKGFEERARTACFNAVRQRQAVHGEVLPDLRIAIREDILAEVDGPMLIHGLQGFHGASLGVVPASRAQRPSTAFLKQRWERFRAAG